MLPTLEHSNALRAPYIAHEFDVMIVDPPYAQRVHDRASTNNCDGHKGRNRDLGFAHLSNELRDAIAECVGSVKRWSVIFSDMESISAWIDAVGDRARYIRTIPWIRWSMPQLSGDRPPSGSEAVLLFHSFRKIHWNGRGNLTHYSQECRRGKDKHPTEKPLDLMLDIVSAFSDPGNIILDPCCGSGTTLQAARLLRRISHGIEKNPEWYSAARRRVNGPLSELDERKTASWIEEMLSDLNSKAAQHSTTGRASARLADVDRAIQFLERFPRQ